MPSLVLIGPVVRPAIGNIQTNKQTDTHIAFYCVDVALDVKVEVQKI